MKPRPIRDRISAAFARFGAHSITYHALAIIVFPADQFPRAWHCASQGGPPGCYMALSAALRRYGWEVYDGKVYPPSR